MVICVPNNIKEQIEKLDEEQLKPSNITHTIKNKGRQGALLDFRYAIKYTIEILSLIQDSSFDRLEINDDISGYHLILEPNSKITLTWENQIEQFKEFKKHKSN